jgi:hypothetical protein
MSFVVLSPNEVDQLCKRQFEETRIKRLLQVREQSKNQARNKREQLKNKKQEENVEKIQLLKV